MVAQFYSKNQRSGIKVGAAVTSLAVVIQMKASPACLD